MTSLILDLPDFSLSVQDNALHIAHPQQPSRLLPLAEIERLIVGKGIALSTDLQLKLSELGKELVIVGHKTSATIFNSASAPNNLRLLQYQAISQETLRQRYAWALLTARRRGQNRVLKQLAMPLLATPSCPPNNLMLYEAEMSRKYWQAWAQCFQLDGFTGRERQPPSDPINALLSLTATLEDHALIPHLLAEGFDLCLGFHHCTGYRRSSLVLDIKELTRSDLEAWLIALWRTKRLTAQHFEQTDYGCRLTRTGQQLFYPAWFGWQKQRKTTLRRIVRLCRRYLERGVTNE
ncbi:CRISPR-associated endonuclease Cas1 [Vibrio metschnikovii]|nr:CRISPR-associated endonuclease Cas1 [Vibrio metschnikovii]